MLVSLHRHWNPGCYTTETMQLENNRAGVFLRYIYGVFFSQIYSCIQFTRLHRYTDRCLCECALMHSKCSVGTGRSWKSCQNVVSVVYTYSLSSLKCVFVCVTSIRCFWIACCVSVSAFSPAHLRWIIAETLLLYPDALETGSLSCCLLGHIFRLLKVCLLWK